MTTALLGISLACGVVSAIVTRAAIRYITRAECDRRILIYYHKAIRSFSRHIAQAQNDGADMICITLDNSVMSAILDAERQMADLLYPLTKGREP